MKSVQAKTILVTGASSGIGKAFAEILAGQGANLILTARSQDRLETLAEQLRQRHGVKIEVVALDLGQPGAALSLFNAIQAKQLSVDVLVNNAGFGKWGGFLTSDMATYGQILQLNIHALMELSYLFLPSMLAKGDGGIINVGSTASFVPVPYAAVYSASKAFVLYFSEALHGEYGDKGIQITALCPGNTASNFASVASSQDDGVNRGADSPQSVAQTGLNAFLAGECTVISGKNSQVAWLARLLPRKRVIRMVGQAWKKILQGRQVEV